MPKVLTPLITSFSYHCFLSESLRLFYINILCNFFTLEWFAIGWLMYSLGLKPRWQSLLAWNKYWKDARFWLQQVCYACAVYNERHSWRSKKLCQFQLIFRFRLISFLEQLLTSTHQSKIRIQAHSDEALALLHGWVLPDCQPLSESMCLCFQAQKQKINTFLEKVEKAVKYSQCIREGRSDVTSPWQDDIANNDQNSELKKVWILLFLYLYLLAMNFCLT